MCRLIVFISVIHVNTCITTHLPTLAIYHLSLYSASEMTYIVSSGALNSTHSTPLFKPIRLAGESISDSHDATFHSPFLPFCPYPFNRGPGYHSPEYFGIKDDFSWVLEHLRHKHQLNFVPLTSLFLLQRISVTRLASLGMPGVPLDAPADSHCVILLSRGVAGWINNSVWLLLGRWWLSLDAVDRQGARIRPRAGPQVPQDTCSDRGHRQNHVASVAAGIQAVWSTWGYHFLLENLDKSGNSETARDKQGCRWYWNSHRYGYGMGMETLMNSPGSVCIIIFIRSTVWQYFTVLDLDRPTWPTPFSRSPGFPVDNACGHRRRRHWTSRLHDRPLSATERFPSPRHEHRTVCQPKWRHQIPCKPSKPN